MKLIIDIPEEAKIAFDNAESNDLKGCYYDHGGVIGNAIKNGIPLEDIKAEIKEIVEIEMKEDEKWAVGLRHSLQIINKHIGKDNK